jgi:hypothetical protein
VRRIAGDHRYLPGFHDFVKSDKPEFIDDRSRQVKDGDQPQHNNDELKSVVFKTNFMDY